MKGPRTAHWMGMVDYPSSFSAGTWIEPEAFSYPNGGKNRRARAICADGKPRIFRCGVPDTFYTVPCKGGGHLYVDEGVLFYHAPRPQFTAPDRAKKHLHSLARLAADYDWVRVFTLDHISLSTSH